MLFRKSNDKMKKEKSSNEFFLRYSKTIIRDDVEKGEGSYLRKIAKGLKEVFIAKGLIYFLIFVAIMVFFIWMWSGFFKDNEPDFKKDFEKDFLPNNSVANTSSQSNSAALQASKTTQQVTNPTSSQNSQASQLTENNLKTEEKKEENKIFESKNLGFSLEYPEGVAITESGDIVTISKDSISWKIKSYNNKNKKDFQAWYTDHFNIKDSAKCLFVDGSVKVGIYGSKQVKPSSADNKCEGDGDYATNPDKSRVVKVELGKETEENVNKILINFKFID
jgi:hypothetical protein